MGQRLVVTVKENKKEICKVYFHWSAYTSSALMEAKGLVRACTDEKLKKAIPDTRLRVLRYLEANGGGIDGGGDSEEFEHIQKLYPGETFKKENISRNQGLFACSEKGMTDLQGWSEGDLVIELDEGEIYNFVYWSYETFDEYAKFYSDSRKEEELPILDFDIANIPFENLDEAICEVREMEASGNYAFRQDGLEEICALIA